MSYSTLARSAGSDTMLSLALRLFFVAFYLYGASVHVLNMCSRTGFAWPTAPTHWKALDIGYLIVDIAVVYGLLIGSRLGVVLLAGAAASQIVLYTAMRDWVLNVPDDYAVDDAQRSYLNVLVGFHILTLIVIFLFY